ncbi:MAG TPA: sulfotransferase [Gammaproteobacteria bacterium]|jgi:hypothetical protein|nr:sulfotransferase [Gammaproteobacteria bacterium]
MDKGMIFVVGNSRCGTTLMGRIFGAHSQVFMFKELKFLDERWPSAKTDKLSEPSSISLIAKLMAHQGGSKSSYQATDVFWDEATQLVQQIKPPVNKWTLFKEFMMHEAQKSGAAIPCEQTPRNLLFAREILDNYPTAHIIAMVRDPRDVLLSQKYRWRRYYLGKKGGHPIKGSLSAWANYHPILSSLIWAKNASIIRDLATLKRISIVQYENLVSEPEKVIRDICSKLDLSFEPSMLKVPHKGSSHLSYKYSESRYISDIHVGKWRSGKLTQSELWLCERITGNHMNHFSYLTESQKWPGIGVGVLVITLFGKLLAAACLNNRRIHKLRTYFRS